MRGHIGGKYIDVPGSMGTKIFGLDNADDGVGLGNLTKETGRDYKGPFHSVHAGMEASDFFCHGFRCCGVSPACDDSLPQRTNRPS